MEISLITKGHAPCQNFVGNFLGYTKIITCQTQCLALYVSLNNWDEKGSFLLNKFEWWERFLVSLKKMIGDDSYLHKERRKEGEWVAKWVRFFCRGHEFLEGSLAFFTFIGFFFSIIKCLLEREIYNIPILPLNNYFQMKTPGDNHCVRHVKRLLD